MMQSHPKAANIGLSTGLCGTDIAKEASDVCILDDNFNSIMMALMSGICVFANVQRFLLFQLTVNVAAVFIAFISSIVGEGESPLIPIQLLWADMTVDSLGALALAIERPRPYLLERLPDRKRVPFLSPVLLINIGGQRLNQITISVLMMTVGEKICTDVEGDSDSLIMMISNTFVFCQNPSHMPYSPDNHL
jgi:Ca2+-transporting ATPase